MHYADNRVCNLGLIFANNYETVYSKSSINRSCFIVETLLRRIDTFDPVCFLYAFLSRISIAMEIYC